jgi:hypothetical protein
MKKEYSEYHKTYYGKKKTRKYFVIFLALALLGLVSFVLIYGQTGVTGNTVSSSLDTEMFLDFKASLSVPEITLKGRYDEVILVTDKKTSLRLDNKIFTLGDPETKIILRGYDGVCSLNENNIAIDAKISEIVINNIPINTEGTKIVISIGPTEYKSLEISDPVYLKKLDYLSSGEIKLGDNTLKVSSDELEFNKYVGKFKVEDKILFLDGAAESLKIDGALRKISLSK